MRYVLLTAAALCATAAVPTAPALADVKTMTARPSTQGGASVRVHRGFGGQGDRDHRRDGRFDDGAAVGFWVDGGEWALYNNRSWEPDSYNDWWHDRPDRAFPRWVQNGSCDRLWWSGGGWRC
jgi:hypothetical protein